MKKQVLLMITFVLCGVFAAWAQNNDKISYQAVVRDSENRLVYNTELQVTVSLANSATGTAVYSERHTVTSNANGLISLLIGDGQDRQGNWGDVRWNTAWVTATVRSADGQTQIAEHHLPLSAVPYALYANYADSMDLAVLQNYLDEHQYVTEDELPSAQANADWTESNPDTASFIKHKPDLGVYATNEHLDDTLGYYTMSNDVDTLLGDYVTKSKLDDTLEHYVLNTDFTDFTDEVGQNFTKMTNRMDTMLTHVCDSVKECVTGWISDSTQMVLDSLGAYYDTTQVKMAIHDTADVLRGMMVDAANEGQITIAVVGGTVENPTFGVNQAENQTVTITVPEATAPNDGLLMIVAAGDTTRFTANQADNDTVRLNKFATKDTLAYYATTSALKDSLSHYVGKEMLNDTLGYYTTTNQLDTVIQKYGYVTTAHLNDTLTAVYNTIRTDSTALHKAIKDTASAIRGDLCDSATACITKALADANSEINHAIDSIARHNISDTATAIRNSIGDGKLTIKNNGNLVGTFYANQNTGTDTEVDIIIPTNVAITNANNTFTAANDFTGGTITVPSNDAIKRPVPTTTPAPTCTNMNAVNVCDLLAVFDSLSRRIDTLQKQLNELKNSTPPVFQNLVLSDTTATTMKVTATFTSQVSPITSYRVCYSTNSNMDGATCVESSSPETTLTGLNPYTRYYVTVTATNLAGTTTSPVQNERTKANAPTANVEFQPFHKGIVVKTNSLQFKQPATGTVQIFYKKSSNCSADDEGFTPTPSSPIEFNDGANYEKCICDLDAGATYCVMVKVCNVDSTTIYGPENITTDNITLSIEAEHESPLYVCDGDSLSVLYVAKLSDNASFDDYNITWAYSGLFSTASPKPTWNRISADSLRITYFTYSNRSSYNYNVTCMITHKTCGHVLNTQKNNTVYKSIPPYIQTCEDGLYVEVKKMSGNSLLGEDPIAAIVWTVNDTTKNPTITSTEFPSYTYPSDGVYGIQAITDKGCVSTLNVALGISTLAPCHVDVVHDDNTVYTTTTGGLEVPDSDGNVISVYDQDNHQYAVVQIGNQCWMKSNLRTRKYSNGVLIDSGTVRDVTHKYYYKPTSSSSFDKYSIDNYNEASDGLYYNWTAVMNGENSSAEAPSGVQGVCPKGWHVPSAAEWDTLDVYVTNRYGSEYASRISSGCEWESKSGDYYPGSYGISTQNRNASGFSGVPTGYFDGDFCKNVNTSLQYSVFWSSTSFDNNNTQTKELRSGNYKLYPVNNEKQNGYSVRCVRNNVTLPDPSLSLTASPDVESVLICTSSNSSPTEDVHTVTYTATIENDNVGNYTFEWFTNGHTEDETGTSFTRSWGTGSYTVVCVATKGSVVLKDTVSVSVTVGATPEFEATTNALTVRLELPVGVHDVDSVAWGDNAGEKVPQDAGQVYHTYQTGGDYTITAYSVEGCTSTTNVSVAAAPAFACGTATVSDADGNTYHTVEIGEGNNAQCWMKENLRTTKYADGTTISQGSNHSTSVAYWYYPNNNANNKPTYGLLYNWKAVMRAESSSTAVPSGVQGICPEGWHVPSDQELQYLISNSSSSTATGKLAGGSSGTWTSSTVSAAPGNYEYGEHNASGFSALPAGCYNDTYYDAFGTIAYFWSSTANPNYSGQSDYVALYYNQSTPYHSGYLQENGYSVRCVCDAASSGGGTSQTNPSVSTSAATVNSNTATLNGTITNSGNVSITSKGFGWKASSASDFTEVTQGVSLSDQAMTYNLENLGVGTYYFYAFISFENTTAYGDTLSFTIEAAEPAAFACGIDSVADNDYANNQINYATVLIGNQCWMKENLRTTKYSDGTDITTYYDYSSSNIPLKRRGLLYDWNTVMNQSGAHDICPIGWHVPSSAEFMYLNISQYQCGGDKNVAKAMADNQYWAYWDDSCIPGYDMTNNNASGFSAIPTGYYGYEDDDEDKSIDFFEDTQVARFWTSTYDGDVVDFYSLRYYNPRLILEDTEYISIFGLSVRCVRNPE